MLHLAVLSLNAIWLVSVKETSILFICVLFICTIMKLDIEKIYKQAQNIGKNKKEKKRLTRSLILLFFCFM